MNVKRLIHLFAALALAVIAIVGVWLLTSSAAPLLHSHTPTLSLPHTPSIPAADDPTPPAETVKLIFIHHSTGENWLADGDGGLGLALAANNYFVSDTNYEWGPPDADLGYENIGDHTDIGHWYNWFVGPNHITYTTALYTEYATHSYYTRLTDPEPSRENEIVMFKSCYPNSYISGSPTEPPTTGYNPLRGQDAWSEYMTVGNVKGIYNDILGYFATQTDKLFILIVSPPQIQSETDAAHAANARAVANWLVNNWLDGYPHNNVAVFDFYNVLTSNGGDANTNDLDWPTGNHHRWLTDTVQHIQTVNNDFSAYGGGSGGGSHPTAAGGQKATGEFVPLLNVFYNRWKSDATASLHLTSPAGGESWTVGSQHAIQWSTDGTVTHINLHYSADNFGTSHEIASNIENTGTYNWTVPDDPSTTARVRVQSFFSPTTVYDVSDPFTILSTSANTYTFDAVITPTNATLPITYTWSGDYLVSGQGTSQATYQLDADGIYSITLTVENCGGTFADTHTITIGASLLTTAQDATMQQVMIFQDGVSPSAGYAGTTDVILARDAESNANLGGTENLETFFGDVENRRSLMRWDLSALPAGITIQGAAVGLYRYDGYAENDMPITLYRVTRAWDEGTGYELWPTPSYVPDGATWLTATTGTAWTTLGGDYDDSTVLDQTTITTDTGNVWISLDATTAVQSWVTGARPNYGLLLRPLSGDYTYHYYHSREAVAATLRPRLIVTYTTGAPAAALNLTAPNASTRWPVSSTQQIEWSTVGSVPQVNLFYSANNFVTSNTITLSLPNTGSYGWTTPLTPTTSARVRVESTISPTTVYDVSDLFRLESTDVSTSTIYLPLTVRNHAPQPPACPYPLTGVVISGPTGGPPASTKDALCPHCQNEAMSVKRFPADASQSSTLCPPLPAPSGTVVTVTNEAQLRDQAQNAAAGTTIMVPAGTYDLQSFVHIANDGITIRGATGNRDDVILDGGGMLTWLHTHAILIEADDVTVADLTIRNADEHAISVNGSDRPTLYNLHIIDTGYQLVKVNPIGDGSEDGVLACSRLEYTTASPEEYTNGISAHDAHRWTVRDNEWYRIRTPGNTPAPTILFWSGSSDTVVERNLLVDCYQGIAFGNASHGSGDHFGGIVRNNFIYASMPHDSVIEMVHATDWLVAHNTALLLYPDGVTWGMEARFSDSQGAFAYNLSNMDILHNRDGAQGVITGNVTTADSSWFVDPASADLHLLSIATNAIDQATSLPQVTDDFDGDTRPSGSAPDVGADEYRMQIPTLSIIAPTDGTLWPVNSTRQIRWTTSESGSVPEVNLMYSTDSFITSQAITAPLTNTGIYTWTTPPTPTTSAQVRIASTVSPTVISDTSGLFTLYDPSTFTNTIYLPLVLRNYVPPPPPCTIPLTGVTISGPTSGSLVLHTFAGIVEPTDATRPITYNWSPVPASGQGTATVSYQWTSPGTYTVTLVATNCGGTANDAHTIIIQSQASGELIQPGDLTYLGAFRLPGGEDPPLTFAYGGNAMAFNPDGDPGNSDAYPGSLFITGHDRLAYGGLPDGSQVAEVSIPVPTIAISPTDLPQAAFIQTFHDVTAGYFTNLEEIPKLGMQYLNHPDTGPLIHLGWGQHLQPPDEPSHAWFSSTLAAPNLQGVWFIGHQNLYSTNGYMFDIPTAWADAYAQGRYLATGRMRDGGQGGMGPTLFAYRPWLEGGTPPISGTHISETVLLLYENAYNTEEITRCMTGYQHPDEWEGGAWITTPSGKSAVLFAGTKSNGTKYWYGYINPAGPEYPCVDAEVTDFTTCRLADGSSCPPEDFSGCCDESAGTCVSNRGWWTTRFDAQLTLYDPNDLAQVAAGEIEPWEPQPYATVDIDERLYLDPPVWDEIEVGWGDQRRARLSAAAYDRENGLLYILELYANEAKPVVHVWGID